jgi:hypothetical protein
VAAIKSTTAACLKLGHRKRTEFKKGQRPLIGASTQIPVLAETNTPPVLAGISGQTAYVCAPARYRDAVENPELELAVGFPMADVRSAGSKTKEAAN